MNKDEYTAYMLEQLDELGDVTSKKMFGGVGFFLDGVMFAKISGDGTFYLRVDDTNRADYEALGAQQFEHKGKKKAMPYYIVPDEILADQDKLVAWATTAHNVAVANKK